MHRYEHVSVCVCTCKDHVLFGYGHMHVHMHMYYYMPGVMYAHMVYKAGHLSAQVPKLTGAHIHPYTCAYRRTHVTARPIFSFHD